MSLTVSWSTDRLPASIKSLLVQENDYLHQKQIYKSSFWEGEDVRLCRAQNGFVRWIFLFYFFWDSSTVLKKNEVTWSSCSVVALCSHKKLKYNTLFAPGTSYSAAAADWCLCWYVANISLVISVWLRNLFHSNHISTLINPSRIRAVLELVIVHLCSIFHS